MGGGEREDERPVKERARVVEHAHGALGKAIPDHLLNLANRGELCALTRLQELNFASEQAPEDLRDELVVRVGLRTQNLLQHVEVLVSIY